MLKYFQVGTLLICQDEILIIIQLNDKNSGLRISNITLCLSTFKKYILSMYKKSYKNEHDKTSGNSWLLHMNIS